MENTEVHLTRQPILDEQRGQLLGCKNATIVTIDMDSGEKIWEKGSQSQNFGKFSDSPSVDKDGAIYVGSQYLQGVFQFHKFDSNGNESWLTDLSAVDGYVSSTYGGKRLTALTIGIDGVV